MENELFEKTKVSKAYMTLALPVVLGMVVSLIYNMVDTFFIARTGNTALIAGVSLGTPNFTLKIALGDIFGVGGSSVISRLFGKKEYEDGRRISVFCFYAAIAVGIAVSIILLAAKQPILGLLGCDETTWQYAGDYYQWIALGAPFIILQLTPNNLLRTEGFAKASMIGTMLGAVVNIILDPIFIYTLGMGAAGAAIATVIGNICGAIFYDIFMIKKCRYLSVDFRKLNTEFDRSRCSRRSFLRHSCIRHIDLSEHRRDGDDPIFAAVWNGQSCSDGNCFENYYDFCSCDGRLRFWRTAAGRIQLWSEK